MTRLAEVVNFPTTRQTIHSWDSGLSTWSLQVRRVQAGRQVEVGIEARTSRVRGVIVRQRAGRITLRGLAITLGLLAFAVAMAVGSIAMRRTRLEKTQELLGEPAIFALQYGKNFFLALPSQSELIDPERGRAWIQPDGSQRTDLTGTPGLGHFRHAILDQKHYDWETLRDTGIESVPVEKPIYVVIEITGPPPEVQPTKIQLELSEGWVGLAGGKQSVQFTSRVLTAIKNFVDTRKDINNSYTR